LGQVKDDWTYESPQGLRKMLCCTEPRSSGIWTIFMLFQMDHVGSSVLRVPFRLCNLQPGTGTWPLFHLHISTGYNISHCWHWFLRNIQLIAAIATDPTKGTIHCTHDVTTSFIRDSFLM
jgi:hypothetical protein